MASQFTVVLDGTIVNITHRTKLPGPDGKRQHTAAEIAEAAGVHRTTVYDYRNLQRRPI